jgi:hypothetical protein
VLQFLISVSQVVFLTHSVLGFEWWDGSGSGCLRRAGDFRLVSVLLKLASLCRRFCFSDCRGSFAYFLALFVCFFGFFVFWFIFRSVEICRDQSFQIYVRDAREFGKADGSGYG